MKKLFIFLLAFVAFLQFSNANIAHAQTGCPAPGWTIRILNASGNDVDVDFSGKPAGHLSVVHISGFKGNYDLPIPDGALDIHFHGIDDIYAATMVFAGCNISNTTSFTMPPGGAGLPGGGGGKATQCGSFDACTSGGLAPSGFSTQSFITQLITKILPIVIGVGGFLAIIMILISATQFITSSGNPEAAASARGRLIFAIVGFALLILAFAITKVIDQIFLKSGAI